MGELVSVIVPVYNIKGLLPYCLSCIANQTYRNLEIILVDDGSDDGSEQLCDQFAETDSRAKVIHKPHQGLWTARNAGQEAATGEYLFFPDGDDYFHRDLIMILYSAINWQGKKYPLSICNTKKTSSLTEDIASPVVPSISILSRADLIQGLFGPDEYRFSVQWNKLYRKALLFSPINRCYLRNQDFDSNLRLYFQINSAVFVDAVLYYYYQHAEQLVKVSNYWAIRYKCEIQLLLQNIKERCADNQEYDHYLLERLYKRMIMYKGFCYNTQSYPEALEICSSGEKQTRTTLFSCKKIPLFKRLGLVLLLHHGSLIHYLMRLTHNLPVPPKDETA